MIQSTTDYDKFKFINENRALTESHVNKLMESIQFSNKLELNPVIVDKDMNVIDGQHRIMAASRLNLPVYYLVDEDPSGQEIIFLNNVKKKWSLENYLNYWVNKKSQQYLHLKEMCDTYEITCGHALALQGKDTGDNFESFRTGGYCFEITEKNLIVLEAFVKLREFYEEIGVKLAINTKLIRAIKIFFSNPDISLERFFEKLSKCQYSIPRRISIEECIKIFVSIYNYFCKQNRLTVSFDCNRIFFSNV